MEKCFNIAGPCFPDEHYMLPPLERLPGIRRIVEQRSYFVLHAARQLVNALAEECVEIIDDDASKPWDAKIYIRDEVVDGKAIHFIGL